MPNATCCDSTEHTVSIGSLNADGQEVSLPQVEVTLYKIEWKWWWDKTPDSLAEYADSSHSSKLQQSIVSTTNGKGEWKFQIKYPEWGRYLIRACDLQGKHCTGKTLYVDWPGWAGGQEDAAVLRRCCVSAATKPAIRSAKPRKSNCRKRRTCFFSPSSQQADRNNAGSTLTGNVPKSRRLPFIRSNPRQRDHCASTPTMQMVVSPFVRYLPHCRRPHNQVATCRKAAGIARKYPNFSISEQSGRAMDYTLAVVDESLLGLTASRPDTKPSARKRLASKRGTCKRRNRIQR